MRNALLVLTGILLAVASAHAQTAPDGAEVFKKACASCHAQPAPDSRAPTREVLRAVAPEAILTALTVGNMFRQGSELTDAERRAVAAFLSGRPVGTPGPALHRRQLHREAGAASGLGARHGMERVGSGRRQHAVPASRKGRPHIGYGATPDAEVGLRLPWRQLRTIAAGGSWRPRIHRERKWRRRRARREARMSVLELSRAGRHPHGGDRAPYKTPAASGYAVYFSDGSAIAYAVDAQTGREIWRRKVDDHPYARATGSLTVYQNRVYVPTAGVGEEGQGGIARYECCTFRGSVSALDASTGAVIWKSYTITEEPKPKAKNASGVQTWGPAGGGIWGAPTIDAARRVVYVTTGNNYSGPATPTTDAVIAMDIDTGKHRWVYQPTPNDVWTGGCRPTNPADSNCPEKLGPDHDFSMSPLLTKGPSGRDIVIVFQKSGMAYGLDPDKGGALVWQYKTSDGSGMGGQWGIAADEAQVYFGVNGPRNAQGGMRATTIDTGQEVWSKPAAERMCGTARGCSSAQGAALTAIPGIVFSGSMDGGVRAYSAKDGSIVWQFDTNKEFETVNGVTANGGAIDGPGPVVADGMLYVTSGYVSLIGRPGNVLLAFGIE